MTRPYLILPTDADYKLYWESVVCASPVTTVHGVKVFFQRNRFEHAFFESPMRNGIKGTVCSTERVQRMSWIRAALTDPASDWRTGWNKSLGQADRSRAVCITDEDFVIVIGMHATDPARANFMSCYRADQSIGRIRCMPCWP